MNASTLSDNVDACRTQSLRDENTALRAELKLSEDKYHALQNDLVQAQTALKALQDTSETKVKDLRRRIHQASALRIELDEKLREVQAVYQSKSWRVTAPLRALSRALSGRWGQ